MKIIKKKKKKILLNGGQLSDDIDTDLFNNGIIDA